MESLVVGRENELAVVSAFLDGDVSESRVLVIEGEAGIGKTTIARAAIARAGSSGVRVLLARPAESEASLPFAALGDLLEPVLDEVLPALALPQRLALEAALQRSAPDEPYDRLAVSRAVLSALRAVVRSAPTLVAIDDVQWLDAPSDRVLEFALRRAHNLPLRILVSRRGADEGPPLGLDGVAWLERLLIGPMALDELDRLVASRFDVQLTRPRLVELERTSGGNPYFALEIMRAINLRDSPLEPGSPLPIPDSIAALLRARIAALSEDARDVVLLAAASPQSTAWQLEMLTGSAAGLEETLGAGILELDGERVRFTHPLLASVAYGGASRAKKREAHARHAAAARDGDGRALHLALATLRTDEAAAAELEEAASRAHRRGAPTAAAELADHARRLTPEDRREDYLRRTTRSAEYHVAAGDTARGRTLLEYAIASGVPGPERATLLLRLGRIRYLSDDVHAAHEVFAQSLAEAGDDRGLSAASEQALAWTAMYGGDIPSALAHARSALALSEQYGDPGMLALALARVATNNYLMGNGLDRALMERAVLLEPHIKEAPLEWLPSYSYAYLAVTADDLERPRELYGDLYASALEWGDESALPSLLFAMSQLECSAGNWRLAGRYAAEAVEHARQSGLDSLYSLALSTQALVDACVGRVDAARAAAVESLQIARRANANAPLMLATATLGFLELTLGDAAAAHGHLQPLSELTVAVGIAEPGVVRFLPDEIEALIALGELEAARRLLLLFEERARDLDRVSARAAAGRCRGLLEAAQGDFNAARGSLAEALAQHARIDQPFERGRTLLVQGTVERRAKHRTPAREALTRALEIFDTLGARLWAEKAAMELARIPGRTRSPGELTETERRVAELVARGLSNKEVAGKLFVTVRAVEANLSKVYAKLGVRSRTELATRFHSTVGR